MCDGNGILYTCTVCPIFVDNFVVGALPVFWLAVAVAGAVVVAVAGAVVVAVAGAVVVACALISEP